MPCMPSRRRLLESLGATSLSLVAGCFGLSDDGTPDGSPASTPRTGTRTATSTPTSTATTPSSDVHWQTKFDSSPRVTPLVDDDRLLVLAEGGIESLDTDTGEVSRFFDHEYEAYLTADDDTIYVVDTLAEMYALNRATGDVRWKKDLRPDAKRVYAAPTLHEGTVYVNTAEHVFAFDAATGDVLWSVHPDVKYQFHSSPAVAAGTVYAGKRSNGVLLAFDAETGDRKWMTRIGDRANSIITQPTATSEAVYVGIESGEIFAVDPADGSVSWSWNVEGHFTSTPTLQGNVVCCTIMEYGVAAFEAATGAERWRVEHDGEWFPHRPVVADDTLFAGAGDHLYVLAPDTGRQRWSVRADGTITAPPVVVEDTVYLSSEVEDAEGHVSAIRRPD